jgi:twitching motility protein PilT
VAAIEADLGVKVVAAIAVRDDLVRLIGQMYGPGSADATDLGDAATDAAGPSRTARVQLDELLDRVMEMGGSDLHLAVGSQPAVRLQGELHRMKGLPALNGSDVRRLVMGMLTERQSERFLEAGELATSHAIPGKGRFRVSAFVQRDSVGAVLRLVPAEIPTPEDLGLPDEVIEWADLRKGLVLVCGPHGSGTSTTLAAFVDRINRTRACHILTLEQPIEFLHKHEIGLVNQREVGEDTASFQRGLRYALRQDPDVLMVGELPDVETIRLALTAAETGQLVLATLRTMDAVKTIELIVDIFPPEQQAQVRVQLATTLRGIVVQQLVPAIDSGVALAAEVLLPTPEVIKCIRTGDTPNLAKAIVGGAASGMGSMDQSLAELVKEGLVDIDVAAERAVDPAELRYLTSGPS